MSSIDAPADDVVRGQTYCLVFSGTELLYPRVKHQMAVIDGGVNYQNAHRHVEDYPLIW